MSINTPNIRKENIKDKTISSLNHELSLHDLGKNSILIIKSAIDSTKL